MQESSKQNYLHGAAMMTAGVVVIKILGAIYKIPLGNILGDEGYGYFSVAYNIYYVFLNMATAGMPVALSRMISEADTLGRPVQARKIFRVAWLTFAIFGLLLGLVMFLFPTELAGMLNNVRAVAGARARVSDEHVPRLCAGHEQHEADDRLPDPRGRGQGRRRSCARVELYARGQESAGRIGGGDLRCHGGRRF